MLNKRFMLIAVFLVSLLAISAVSANENTDSQLVTSEVDVSLSSHDDEIIAESLDDSLSGSGGEETNWDDGYVVEYDGEDYDDVDIDVIARPLTKNDDNVTVKLSYYNNNAPIANANMAVLTNDYKITKMTTDSNGIAVCNVPYKNNLSFVVGFWHNETHLADYTNYNGKVLSGWLYKSYNSFWGDIYQKWYNGDYDNLTYATIVCSEFIKSSNGKITIRVTESENRTPMANVDLAILTNDYQITKLTTNSSGIATYAIHSYGNDFAFAVGLWHDENHISDFTSYNGGILKTEYFYSYDEYIGDFGTNAKLEFTNLPSDAKDKNVALRLYDLDNDEPLANIDLGVMTSYDWKCTKITTDSNGAATYKVPFSNAVAGIHVGLWSDGEDGIGITTVSDDDMHCNFLKGIVNVTQIQANLKIVLDNSYYKTAVLKVYLLTTSNQPVANENIKITFSNGKSATITTNSKGIASYSLPFTPGTYSVGAKLLSDAVIAKAVSKKISILKAVATITPTKLSTSYASGKYFQIKVINSKNKKAMSNVKLTLKIYTGKKYVTKTVTTNSNGIAKYSASALSIGAHKVVVSVKDTKCISSKSKTSSIKITKGVLKITAPKVNNRYKGAGTFVVTVKNKESSAAIKNIKVTVKVYTGSKYKTYNLKTNAKGQVSISTKSLSKTTHKVVVNVKSTSKYKASKASSSIKISNKKLNTTLGVSISRHYANDFGSWNGAYLKVILKDESGKNINRKINYEVYYRANWGSDTVYHRGTLTSNEYTELSISPYSVPTTSAFARIEFKFNGDSTYESSKNTVKLFGL